MNQRKMEQGFSLLELLATALILGVGLLGLAALQTMGIRSYGASRQRDAAAYLASSILDQFASQGQISALLKEQSQTVPATLNLVHAAVGKELAYTHEGKSRFGLDGRPLDDGPFTATLLIRENTKGGSPTTGSNMAGHEVVVNVGWTEAVPTGAGGSVTQPKWLSMSRFIRF